MVGEEKIVIHNEEEVSLMRQSCKLASALLDYIGDFVKPGVTTEELDLICYNYILEHGAYPSPLNYQPYPGCPPYPKSICTSVNEEVCHGIPNSKQLKEGSIVNLDVTVYLNGFHGDSSRMFLVGKVDKAAQRLCRVTEECMYLGIEQIKPGGYLGDIGYAIESYASANGYSVVREFCGHGIGRKFHTAPEVLHYGKPNTGVLLLPGMIFTVEPMINQGKRNIKKQANGWTYSTSDRSLSAQWEHTVLVTTTGVEILTA